MSTGSVTDDDDDDDDDDVVALAFVVNAVLVVVVVVVVVVVAGGGGPNVAMCPRCAKTLKDLLHLTPSQNPGAGRGRKDWRCLF